VYYLVFRKAAKLERYWVAQLVLMMAEKRVDLWALVLAARTAEWSVRVMVVYSVKM
jgi:hypothetical protein